MTNSHNDGLTPIDLEKFVDDNISLLKLPDTVSHLNMLCNEKNSTLLKQRLFFAEHPALAEKILSYTDSPLCEPRLKFTSINQAISILGIEQLRDLAIKIALQECSASAVDVNVSVADLNNFWSHSLYCAIASRTIAQHLGMEDYKDFFLMGLLHDIGALLMTIALHDKFNRWIVSNVGSGEERTYLEQHAYGFDHAKVGNRVLKHWNLSEKINVAVSYHHQPGTAGDYVKHASIIQIADIMTSSLAPLASDAEDKKASLDTRRAAESLDMPEADIITLIKVIDNEFTEMNTQQVSLLLKAS